MSSIRKPFRAPPFWEPSYEEQCKSCLLHGNATALLEKSLPGRRLRKRRKGTDNDKKAPNVNQSNIRRHIKSSGHIHKYLSLTNDNKIEADEWLLKNHLLDLHNNIIKDYEDKIIDSYDTSTEIEHNAFDGVFQEGPDDQTNEHIAEERRSEAEFEFDKESEDEEETNLIFVDEHTFNYNTTTISSEATQFPVITALNTKNSLQLTEDNISHLFRPTTEHDRWFPFHDEMETRLFMDHYYIFNHLSLSDRSSIFLSVKKIVLCNSALFPYSLYSLKKLLKQMPIPQIKNICYNNKENEKVYFSVLSIKDILSMILLCPKYAGNINGHAIYSGSIEEVFNGEKWQYCREMQQPCIAVCNKILWQGKIYVFYTAAKKIICLFHSYRINSQTNSLEIIYLSIVKNEEYYYVSLPSSYNDYPIISELEITNIEESCHNILRGYFKNSKYIKDDSIKQRLHWSTKKSFWENKVSSSTSFSTMNLSFWTDGVQITKHKGVESFTIEMVGFERSKMNNSSCLLSQPIQIGIAEKLTNYSSLKCILSFLKEELINLERGYFAVNSLLKETTILHGIMSFTKGDNPVQNDLSSFPTGSKSKCRVCFYDSNRQHNFEPANNLRNSFKIRKLYDQRDSEEMTLTNLSTRKAWAKQNDISEQRSPLLDIDSFDVCLDTPTDLLHTMYLGMAKYLCKATKEMNFSTYDEIFKAKMNEIDYTFLPIVLYSSSYKSINTFVGKEMHTFLSIAPFIYYNKFDEASKAFTELGFLSKLLYYKKIENYEIWEEKVNSQIKITIETINSWSPSILNKKIKPHLLFHIPLWVRRHGTTLKFNTERNEASNIKLKNQIKNTNFLAVSKDIAKKASLDFGIEFLLDGGFFPWETNGKIDLVQAGSGVLELADELRLKKSNTQSSSHKLKKGNWFVIENGKKLGLIKEITKRDGATIIFYSSFEITNNKFRYGKVLKLLTESLEKNIMEVTQLVNVQHYCSSQCGFSFNLINDKFKRWEHDIHSGIWVINPFITNSQQHE